MPSQTIARWISVALFVIALIFAIIEWRTGRKLQIYRDILSAIAAIVMLAFGIN